MTDYFLPRRRDESSDDAEILGQSEGIRTNEGDRGLEIDLPEGQRVTIGGLPPGTVLEIISWQGTGSPGNDASRLLLGAVSVESTNDDEETTAAIASTSSIPPVSATAGRATLGEPPAARRGRRRIRAAFAPTLVSVAVVLAVLLVPVVAGLGSWSLVDRGPSWALGSTRGSLVLVADGSRATDGSRVLTTPKDSTERWLGFLVDVPGVGSEIRSGAVSLEPDASTREVRVIVPWLGYPVIWVGELLGR